MLLIFRTLKIPNKCLTFCYREIVPEAGGQFGCRNVSILQGDRA